MSDRIEQAIEAVGKLGVFGPRSIVDTVLAALMGDDGHVVLAERPCPHHKNVHDFEDGCPGGGVVVLESTNVVVPNGRIPTIMAIPVPCIVARLDDA